MIYQFCALEGGDILLQVSKVFFSKQNIKLCIQVAVFWVVTPFTTVVGYQRFEGPCCFRLQGEVRGAWWWA
jgi:hypothetical protein